MAISEAKYYTCSGRFRATYGPRHVKCVKTMQSRKKGLLSLKPPLQYSVDPAGVRSLGQEFHSCSAPGTELTPGPISPVNVSLALYRRCNPGCEGCPPADCARARTSGFRNQWENTAKDDGQELGRGLVIKSKRRLCTSISVLNFNARLTLICLHQICTLIFSLLPPWPCLPPRHPL